MSPGPIRVALVGYGKIAADSHVPAIRANADFALAAVVSARGAGPAGVPVFPSLDALLNSDIAVDAVSHCNTPAARRASAVQSLSANKHCLLEKPPAATLADWHEIAAAQQAGTSLMTGWHSQANAAVAAAKAWLADKRIDTVLIDWREDVRKWHPGQQWIWDEGGFGVFDPGINGLSIATHILPAPITPNIAQLEIPTNQSMPIAAKLVMGMQDRSGIVVARFDWRETAGECWRITVATDQGELVLDDGGSRLIIDGDTRLAHDNSEYPRLYQQFAALIREGRSMVDIVPLALVCDALARGQCIQVAPFED